MKCNDCGHEMPHGSTSCKFCEIHDAALAKYLTPPADHSTADCIPPCAMCIEAYDTPLPECATGCEMDPSQPHTCDVKPKRKTMNLSNPIGFVFPNGFRVTAVTLIDGRVGVLQARRDDADYTTYVTASFTQHSIDGNEWINGDYSQDKQSCNEAYQRRINRELGWIK